MSIGKGLPDIAFIQAKHFTRSEGREIRTIVIHSMEAPEKGQTAEACARYFQRGERVASAHYCVDNDSIVKCVRCQDVAYGCPNANRYGLHIEHAGYARQTRGQWLDAYGKAMLTLSARLVAALCETYGIPTVWLKPAEILLPGARGITSHANVTAAYKRRGGHTDPGPGFPVDWYMQAIRAWGAQD